MTKNKPPTISKSHLINWLLNAPDAILAEELAKWIEHNTKGELKLVRRGKE
jgi:hypothetical protein